MDQTRDGRAVVNAQEAKAHLSKLLDRVLAGEEILLAKAGVPCARLVPLESARISRKPGRLNARLDDAFFDPLDGEESRVGSE